MPASDPTALLAEAERLHQQLAGSAWAADTVAALVARVREAEHNERERCARIAETFQFDDGPTLAAQIEAASERSVADYLVGAAKAIRNSQLPALLPFDKAREAVITELAATKDIHIVGALDRFAKECGANECEFCPHCYPDKVSGADEIFARFVAARAAAHRAGYEAAREDAIMALQKLLITSRGVDRRTFGAHPHEWGDGVDDGLLTALEAIRTLPLPGQHET
jgi:hypothetical protein